METIKLDSILEIAKEEQFVKKYGLRSYNLWLLQKYSKHMGYKVPGSVLISSDLSIETSKYLGIDFDIYSILNSNNYLSTDSNVLNIYYNQLLGNKELISVAESVDIGNSPIIRGTSCAEGYKNLSFAGICHSYIPKTNLSLAENVTLGTAKVLASIHSPYAKYYFRVHNIPAEGKNIGIIMMKMLHNPLFHATAYVYPTEIRIKYFFTPQTGTVYHGGGDVVVTSENEEEVLGISFPMYKKVWKHTFKVLRNLLNRINSESSPLDIEFLIVGEKINPELNIVQVRKLSDVHFDNYKKSSTKNTFFVSSRDILIGETHLYHSVIDCQSKINTSENYSSEGKIEKYTEAFVVKYDSGEGLFSFVNSLPTEKVRIGLLVTHPDERSHDHFQYSIYEDERIKFIMHANEKLISRLENGMIVHVISNGKKAVISSTGKYEIDNLNINFIDENSLPNPKIISAVFLVGFIDEKIIAARNERGWDVPGGHVDSSDTSLISSLEREIDEEAGVIVKDAKPYAVLKFKNKEKVMLFYTSNDCKLVDFVPKEDAFERKLMAIPEFISKYNWKKEIMELLIRKALEVLNL